METVLERVREVVFKMQRGELTERQGMAEIERLVRSMGWSESRTAAVLQQAAAEYAWIRDRTTTPERQELYNKIVDKAGSQFALTKAGIVKDVRSGVLPLLKKGASVKELESAVLNIQGRRRRYFSTIARTAASAFDTAGGIFEAQDAGFEWFRYTGPNAERPFCIERLGKVYHVTEILSMDNNMDLPVMIYKGGWNCRHTWSPVPEAVARAERPEWFVSRGTLQPERKPVKDAVATLTKGKVK